jgi:hypothetical protein
MQNKFDGWPEQMLAMVFCVSNKIFGQDVNEILQYQNPLASMVLLCELCSLRLAEECLRTYLVQSTYGIFCTRGYERQKNRKASCTLSTAR